jgi:hypothetical protein
LSRIEDMVQAEPVSELVLKGFRQPVPAFNVAALR